MIQNHEIKYINNEQILYIYLDFNSEFAKLNTKKTKRKLKKEIKKYIDKNKIDFKGTTVAIIVGGIMIATVILNNPKINNKELLNNNYTISLINKDNNYKFNNNEILLDTNNDNVIEETKENEEIIIDNENIKTNTVSNNETKNKTEFNTDNKVKKETKTESNTDNKVNTDTKTESTNNKTNIYTETKLNNYSTKTNSNESSKTETNTSSTIQSNKEEQIKETTSSTETKENLSSITSKTETKENTNDNNTYVTIYRQNGTVLTLEIEEYLVGVVGSEMPASFNIEALKAQAILSRTYTYKALNTNKKLTDTTSTQVYKSNSELKQIWGSSYNTYYNKIRQAVDSTKGIVLTYNGTLIEAVYHSTSNGKTENSSNVWSNSFPYLVSVDSPYDTTNKSFSVTTFYTYEELSNKLNTIITQDTIFNTTLNESNRVKTIEFNNITYTGVEFRTKLNLRSADFILDSTLDGINITTKGYGHGVGMSQYGANGMANNGSNYESILKYYYKGVSLSYK